MLIKRPADIKPSEITPERVWRARRRFMRDVAAGTLVATAPTVFRIQAAAAGVPIENVTESAFSTDESRPART